ncbi:MAG TPA: hypothetical protein VIV59_06475 [Anaeromyxobacteraceae bacterium]
MAAAMSHRALALLAALALAACRPEAAPPPGAATGLVPPAAPAPGEPQPFEVALRPPAAAKVGQAATATVALRAKGTFHVNRDYPMAFRPEPDSTAAFGGVRIPLGEGAEKTPCAAQPEEACAVSLPLRFTPEAPGAARLAGTVAFSVCNAELCRIEKVPLEMSVVAER